MPEQRETTIEAVLVIEAASCFRERVWAVARAVSWWNIPCIRKRNGRRGWHPGRLWRNLGQEFVLAELELERNSDGNMLERNLDGNL
jgi:hypothetical protein